MPVAAFTLTELLVVTAILTLLAVTQLPALTRAKAPVKHTQCANNLRQLGVALQIHVSETGVFPLTVDGNTTNIWYTTLADKYAYNNALMQCPTFKGERPIESAVIWILGVPYLRLPSGPGKIAGVSYGYNGFGVCSANATSWSCCLGLGQVVNLPFTLPAVADTAVVSPADMVAIGDSMPQPGYSNLFSFLLSINTQPIDERHGAGYNVAFVDGHVITIPHKKLVENSSDNRRRWNIDHEPHHEITF